MTMRSKDIDIAAVRAILGPGLSDPALVAEAFTHQSYANGRPGVRDNQRLEFLGDAVLGLLSAEALCAADPDADEGAMTARRSALVSGASLAAVATGLGLPRFMRFADGVRDETERTGTRTAAALMEAVFGAIWLSGGIAPARELFLRLFGDAVGRLGASPPPADPRGVLQTLSRRLGFGEPAYTLISQSGDGRDFTFTARVSCGPHSAEASAPGKRRAFAAAAARLLESMRQQGDKR